MQENKPLSVSSLFHGEDACSDGGGVSYFDVFVFSGFSDGAEQTRAPWLRK